MITPLNSRENLDAFQKGPPMITPRRINRLSLVLSFTVALSLHAWGQQPDGTRRYEDPSGLFKITIPEDWEVVRTENAATGITTRFHSPDEASLLSIVGGLVPLPGKLPPGVKEDDLIVEISQLYFDGFSRALADKTTFEDLKVGPRKKEEFQGHPCLRQDFSYRRKASPTPRESSAFFFHAGDIELFIVVSGTVDGVKKSLFFMDTLTVGNVKASDLGPFKPDEAQVLKDAMGKPDEVRKAIARLEAKWKAAPTNLKVMNDLHTNYANMIYHYTEGELKGDKDAEAMSSEYLEKDRLLCMSIATESLRTMKIPDHVTKPDPTDATLGLGAKDRIKTFEVLAGYEKLTKRKTVFLPVFRNVANSFARDAVNWMEKADLGTRLDRERSARLLGVALGLFAVMEKHFQGARANADRAKAAPEETDFTEAERRLRDQIQKTLEKLAPKDK